MKKLILFLTAFFILPCLNAAQDNQGSMRPAIWRSSRTASNDGFAMIGGTTPIPVIIHAINVSSAGLSIPSTLSLFNASTTINSVQPSTVSLIDTSVNREHFYDTVFTSACIYTKTGTAEVNILWDYLVPSQKPFYFP